MKPWNEAYRMEAEIIAASVFKECGYRWTAAQIQRGKQAGRIEVVIAMRALMVARGEIEVKEDISLSTYGLFKHRT